MAAPCSLPLATRSPPATAADRGWPPAAARPNTRYPNNYSDDYLFKLTNLFRNGKYHGECQEFNRPVKHKNMDMEPLHRTCNYLQADYRTTREWASRAKHKNSFLGHLKLHSGFRRSCEKSDDTIELMCPQNPQGLQDQVLTDRMLDGR